MLTCWIELGCLLFMSAMSCRRNFDTPTCRRHVGTMSSTCNSFVSSVRSVVGPTHDVGKVGDIESGRHVGDINNQAESS